MPPSVPTSTEKELGKDDYLQVLSPCSQLHSSCPDFASLQCPHVSTKEKANSNCNLLCNLYRVTRRVFSEPVTSKLHLLNTKNLAGHLKTPKVIRISAMHANFSHSPVHSGPICFHRTKNLKLPSGTNKSK